MKPIYYHIIVSPPIEERTKFIDPIFLDTAVTYFKKHCEEYTLALEHGAQEDLTHIDISLKFNKGQDKTDIERKYNKLFDGLEFHPPAIMIKACKSNPHAMVGYTLKEDPEHYRTNLTDEVICERTELYHSLALAKSARETHKVIGIQSTVKLLGNFLETSRVEYWNNECIKHGEEPYTKDDMPRSLPTFPDTMPKAILSLTHSGYYMNISKFQKHSLHEHFAQYYMPVDKINEQPPAPILTDWLFKDLKL